MELRRSAARPVQLKLPFSLVDTTGLRGLRSTFEEPIIAWTVSDGLYPILHAAWTHFLHDLFARRATYGRIVVTAYHMIHAVSQAVSQKPHAQAQMVTVTLDKV